jgi:glycosyltransferase involved in cell wall biosynthesis
MGRSLRVLHLINGEYFGGSARVLMNYVESEARRADVAVGVHFEGELEHRLRAAQIETEVIAMRGRLDLAAARSVLRLARRFRADIVHTHQVRNTLLARLAATGGGPPVVTHVHSPAFRESTDAVRNAITGTVDRVLARRTRRFIAVSESLAGELRRLGIRRDRIRVVPNGIPLPAAATGASRAALRTELGLPATEPLIGMVANFRPRKGTEDLLDAAGLLAASGIPVRLVLVGEAFREGARDYAAELRQRAERLQIADRVIFTGFRADPDRVIAGLDAFVLPSRFGEGLPMVLLEAMGAGVPVITTPVEGIVEVVEDGRNGRLVPAEDPASLAAALRGLIEEPSMGVALGEAGRQTVLSRYTSSRMAAGFERVYEEVARLVELPR